MEGPVSSNRIVVVVGAAVLHDLGKVPRRCDVPRPLLILLRTRTIARRRGGARTQVETWPLI